VVVKAVALAVAVAVVDLVVEVLVEPLLEQTYLVKDFLVALVVQHLEVMLHLVAVAEALPKLVLLVHRALAVEAEMELPQQLQALL
jgi:hypothetical protein